jgi:hypothetical protein
MKRLETMILCAIIFSTLAAFVLSLPACSTDTECGCSTDCLESAQ